MNHNHDHNLLLLSTDLVLLRNIICTNKISRKPTHIVDIEEITLLLYM